MRKNVGRARARGRQRSTLALKQTGAEVRAAEVAHIAKQWAFVGDKLREFAAEHRAEINTRPAFRREFMKMCVEVGVDPLSSSKSFWGSVMGNLSQFYHELGVQILDVCYGTRSQNGGLIDIDDLVLKLRWLRGGRADQQISRDDVATSVAHLKTLGNGLRIVDVAGGGAFVLSVPQEFDMDHQVVLAVARDSGGFVTEQQLREAKGWSQQRVARAVKQLLQSGMVWLDLPSRGTGGGGGGGASGGGADADADAGADGEGRGEDAAAPRYWFPSLFDADAGVEELGTAPAASAAAAAATAAALPLPP